MPGIVTSAELDFNSAYSPDGKSFYFGRSENGKWVLYVTTFDGKTWSTPVHPAFNDTTYSEADPVFSPDGSLYYISTRPRNDEDTIHDYDIWWVKEIGGNKWSEPVNMAIVNSDSNEFYVSFASNRNLYFSSSRQGGYGQEDIYLCQYKGDHYAQPVNMGEQVNSTGSDHDALITTDEQYLIFSSSGRKDSYGQADLYITKHSSGQKWQEPVNLGKRFNTSTYEYCSYLSPDNQYFFYSSESDVKWIKADYLFKDMEESN
jgi:Tol biopolymer transport system component